MKTRILHVFTLLCTAKSFFDGQFRYISEHGFEQYLSASDTVDEEFCHRNNISYHRLPLARRIDIKSDIKAVCSAVRYIRSQRIEVVVGHTPKGALIAMAAGWIGGVKRRIYYRHGLIYTTQKGLKKVLFKSVERVTAAFATHIINVSPSLGELAIRDKLNPSRKQTVIGKGTCGGIDAISRFNPANVMSEEYENIASNLCIEPNSYVIGYVGRLCPDKGIAELIDGFKLFKESHPDISAKLLLIGNPDARDVLPDEIMEIAVADNDIILTGQIDNDRLPLYYSLMDVFVFPSYREGFGMSVLEASAMEIPILVSRSHGCIDSINEHVTGEYIEISGESICQGLGRMMNREKAAMLGSNGRKFVLEDFDKTVMWPKVLECFQRIASK